MDYPDYVPGPTMATVVFKAAVDAPEVRISALYGLPKVTNVVSMIPIPGTIGQFAPVVVGHTTSIVSTNRLGG